MTILKNKYVRILAIVLIVASGAVIIGAVLWQQIQEKAYKARKPQSNSASSFLYQERGYQCSKEIPGEWVEAGIGPQGAPGYYFVPQNKEDLDKFCRRTFVIEYRAVLDILKQEDVNEIIEKYDTTEAWVKALSHVYIEDKEFLWRILPSYADIKIDCIIVVHSPEGTRFFIENGEVHESHDDHRYIEVKATEFLRSLNDASDRDVANFWLGLR